ncbi:hypothetical protein PV341_07750 [Streptomyces sp. PA03-1a]|nr:hypothetical protein [Streptomyces sp. PA03-1a]
MEETSGPRARYVWRIDVLDGPPGPGWQPWDEGEDDIPPSWVEAAAAAYLAHTGARDYSARILVWAGEQGADEAAVYRANR